MVFIRMFGRWVYLICSFMWFLNLNFTGFFGWEITSFPAKILASSRWLGSKCFFSEELSTSMSYSNHVHILTALTWFYIAHAKFWETDSEPGHLGSNLDPPPGENLGGTCGLCFRFSFAQWEAWTRISKVLSVTIFYAYRTLVCILHSVCMIWSPNVQNVYILLSFFRGEMSSFLLSILPHEWPLPTRVT